MKIKTGIVFASALLLTACAVGPDYKRPSMDVPAAYKEAGDWKKAAPADTASRGPWWSVYNDPVLDGLEKQVQISNQNLKAAEAAYREAMAVVRGAQASFFPVAEANGSFQKTGGKGSKGAGSAYSASLGATWEPDLWGRIRRTVESNKDSAEASAADLASATLSAQATLAIDYFQLRATDQLKRLLDDAVTGYERSLQITQNQYKAGIISREDVVQAQTQLDSTRSQAVNTGIARAQLEHAIAVLTGKPPAQFALAPSSDLPDVPSIPAAVPSALLERQPDIAGAERRMAAANAEIGVAEAAFFPDITLSASDGFGAASLGKLLSASSNVWAFGPQLAWTLFDAGARQAQVDEAKASYQQQVALYKQSVLTGFQQVEDQLAALRVYAQQADIQANAVKSANEAEAIANNQYKAGVVAYTNVVVAEVTALNNRETALSIRENRLTTSVALIQALGGSWDGNLEPRTTP